MQIRLSFSLSKGAFKKRKKDLLSLAITTYPSFLDFKCVVQLATKVTEMEYVQELVLY